MLNIAKCAPWSHRKLLFWKLGLAFALVTLLAWVWGSAFASFRRTLSDIYFPYFSPTRRVRGHFATLIEVYMHLMHFKTQALSWQMTFTRTQVIMSVPYLLFKQHFMDCVCFCFLYNLRVMWRKGKWTFLLEAVSFFQFILSTKKWKIRFTNTKRLR